MGMRNSEQCSKGRCPCCPLPKSLLHPQQPSAPWGCEGEQRLVFGDESSRRDAPTAPCVSQLTGCPGRVFQAGFAGPWCSRSSGRPRRCCCSGPPSASASGASSRVSPGSLLPAVLAALSSWNSSPGVGLVVLSFALVGMLSRLEPGAPKGAAALPWGRGDTAGSGALSVPEGLWDPPGRIYTNPAEGLGQGRESGG